MEEKLLQIKNAAIPLILDAKNPDELEEIKLQFLGRSGQLTTVMKNIKDVSPEKRPEIGQLINETKTIVENAIDEKMQSLTTTRIERHRKSIDVTDPGIRPPLGHLHLITQAINEISQIFEHIGFTRARYPEIEFDWYAFEALNFPEDHPARDDWETFFISQKKDPKYGPVVLTPHTSSGQIREMERTVESLRQAQARSKKSSLSGVSSKTDEVEGSSNEKLSIRMINIAKCYRRQSDVSHTPMFHQFEGLCVDEKISITHLKGVLDYFFKSFLGTNRDWRIRPYHFQFTEPSFEVDVTCAVCLGKGCRLCKEGWLELGGCGMVHPNVLRNCGIDPEKYSGFAFGWGVERVLMMKEGIELDDLRLLYNNKLEFLEQF